MSVVRNYSLGFSRGITLKKITVLTLLEADGMVVRRNLKFKQRRLREGMRWYITWYKRFLRLKIVRSGSPPFAFYEKN